MTDTVSATLQMKHSCNYFLENIEECMCWLRKFRGAPAVTGSPIAGLLTKALKFNYK
jgi:hypothetical protein